MITTVFIDSYAQVVTLINGTFAAFSTGNLEFSRGAGIETSTINIGISGIRVDEGNWGDPSGNKGAYNHKKNINKKQIENCS